MRVISVLSLILGLLPIWASPSFAEITCSDPSYECVEWSDGELVGGINIGRHCARYAGTQQCVDSDPIDQCTALRASTKCERTSRECVDYKNGACRQWRERFSCLNEDADMSPAILTNTEFGPTQESIINQCSEYEGRGDCELVSIVTTEGPEIRDINRKTFSRSWWRRERTYSCVVPGEGDNTCGPLESDPTCVLQSATCLVEENGVCSNREFHYQCGVSSGDLETSCEPINVCVGDNCIGVEQETSDDFGSSAAWLNVLAQMQREYRAQAATDPDDVRFFQGRYMSCSKAPGRNCCSTGGIFGSTCPDSAGILRDKRAAGATHYVGVTCQQKVLGACIKKRYHYCTYNSKFARVFIEEFKDQVEEGWGGAPNSPHCGSVTIEDFGNVDIEEMDLSEVFGDIMGSIQLPVSEGLQDFFEDRFPNAGDDAQDTYEELAE